MKFEASTGKCEESKCAFMIGVEARRPPRAQTSTPQRTAITGQMCPRNWNSIALMRCAKQRRRTKKMDSRAANLKAGTPWAEETRVALTCENAGARIRVKSMHDVGKFLAA